MAATFQSISTAAPKTTAGVASLTLNAPAGGAVDDLYIASIAYRGSGTITLPTGWTLIQQQNIGNTSGTLSQAISSGIMAYILRDTVEPSFVFGGFPDIAIGVVTRINGQSIISPIGDSSSVTLATRSVTLNGSALTVTGGNLVLMTCCGATSSSWTNQSIGAPTSLTLTERVDATNTNLGQASISVATGILPNTETTGTPTATASASTRNSQLLVEIRNPSVAKRRSYGIIV